MSDDKEVAAALESIAMHLKYLGVGDAATTMGAIECLTVAVEKGCENIAGALHQIALAIKDHGEG